MKKITAKDIKGLEEQIAKTCGFDVEDVPRFADDHWYIDENQELFTMAEDGTDELLPLGFSLKQARYIVYPVGGGRSKIDLLKDARFFATKREAIEYSKMREEDEVREYYRSKPFCKVEFSELTKDEIDKVWNRFKNDGSTTDWIVMSLEEFEKQQNVKFKESLLITDFVYASLAQDFYDDDGRLIEEKLEF